MTSLVLSGSLLSLGWTSMFLIVQCGFIALEMLYDFNVLEILLEIPSTYGIVPIPLDLLLSDLTFLLSLGLGVRI